MSYKDFVIDVLIGLMLATGIIIVSVLLVLSIIGLVTDTYVKEEDIERSEKEKAQNKIIYIYSDQSLSEDTSESKSVEAVTDNQQIELTDNEEYLLAKLVECEASICSEETKVKIIQVVCNRVKSDKFPNSIFKVIHEVDEKGNYQFSPLASGGSWYYTEPSKESYEAVESFQNKSVDDSQGILYFESCKDKENWHSNNLEYVNTYDGIRFYR